ncbi:MAG TPA: AmmeMemoRadiSam system protein A [Elusimicrobiota bacterium]|nr:AmmeMemoRadiSam system protein A [Elusimicrobiota bacterium]
MFSIEDQHAILQQARSAIAGRLGISVPAATLRPELADAAYALFVTLHAKGELRGCIGLMRPEGKFSRSLTEMALAAAFEDPRFSPLTQREYPDIEVEVSVLSPLQRVSRAEEIEPGRHGVMVRRGPLSGVFLPQVWETLRERETFLGTLCRQKAGLPENAWREPSTELYVFTVEILREDGGAE